MRVKRTLVAGLVVLGAVSVAQAGWVIEENTVFTKPNGEARPAEPATMRISQGRIRLSQPSAVTVQDCVKGTFAIYVPDRNSYWSGTLDEYTAQIAAAGQDKGAKPSVPKIDVATLPKIEVKKTDDTAKIGGYDSVKYVILSNGTTFQEIWMTKAFNVNDDLKPDNYLECQRKMSVAMQGNAAGAFNALYRSPEYRELVTSGFPMKTVVYHSAGSYTREVRSVSRADVPDSDFSIPAGAHKKSLNDLFGPPQ